MGVYVIHDRMTEIHSELNRLNAEANRLTDKINKNEQKYRFRWLCQHRLLRQPSHSDLRLCQQQVWLCRMRLGMDFHNHRRQVPHDQAHRVAYCCAEDGTTDHVAEIVYAKADA